MLLVGPAVARLAEVRRPTLVGDSILSRNGQPLANQGMLRTLAPLPFKRKSIPHVQ